MRAAGVVWYVAGILTVLAVQNGWIEPALRGIITALSRVVTFLGAVGTGVLLVITAVAFWRITRTVTENARARFDMDNVWKARKRYRENG